MLKKIIIVAVILATLLLFGYYLAEHPELLQSLFRLDPLTIALLTLGYSLMIIINALILHWSLHFVGYKIPLLENALLTGYSTIVNFFGPLQSGPGVRAIYLKKRHAVRLRDFSVTLLVFYAFFAAINGAVLLVAFLDRFTSPFAYGFVATVILLASTGLFLALRKREKFRQILARIKLSDRNLWLIALGALISVVVTAWIYYVELSHITEVGVGQTLIYTAAANFALFVSLTPGAIGFRESFVIITQQLHGINTETIIGANVIDRAFYVAFLLVLFLVLLALNARRKLAIFDKSPK